MIKELFKLNRNLLGEGYDKALAYISQQIGLDIIDIPSGTQFGTWTVPDEWILKDAWIKDPKGNKILEKDNFNVMVYSRPIHGFCELPELKEHLYYSDESPELVPYVFDFYDRPYLGEIVIKKKKYGFCVKRDFIKKKIEQACEGGTCVPELKNIDPTVGKVRIEGINYNPKYEDVLEEGEYEVFIDSELKPGTLKIGVHTIKGKTDREILLFAHLDHPYQANDNLSGVKCLMDLVEQLKDKDHTIKIIFCPETIGSIAYAETQDISKVDFVIAVDACGNDNTLLIQKAFDKYHRINYAVHLAVQELGVSYRKADFRLLTGSDEYYFNDPLVGIPGIMLSRYPYKEYHTYADTPEIIKEDMIKQTGDVILKTIEIYEKDFIPVRNYKGVLCRNKFDIQTPYKNLNRDMDYLFYDMDGKKWLSEICLPLSLTFTYANDVISKLGDLIKKNGEHLCVNNSKRKVRKSARKKQKGLQGETNVPVER